MEYSRITNENIDLIEDYLQEYIDKYNLVEEDRFYSFQDSEFSKRFTYKGYYVITKVSTKIFKVVGFPDNKSGYLVRIHFYLDIDKSDWKNDMYKFITRICKSGFEYDTFIDNRRDVSKPTYYIAFFK